MDIYRSIKADGHIFTGPCKLKVAVLSAAAGGAATVALYDASAKEVDPFLTLTAPATAMGAVDFGSGLPLDRGLYADVGSNVTNCVFLLDVPFPASEAD